MASNIVEKAMYEDNEILGYWKDGCDYLIKYRKHPNNKLFDNNVVAACIITSRARITLLKLILDAYKNNFKILYYDTDSIFIQTTSVSNLEFLKKKSWDRFDWIEFYSEKNYKFYKNNIVTQKGLEKNKHHSFKRKTINNSTEPYTSFDLILEPHI
jgi:hypothetical protein